MTELEINQIIHEAMGKCWHDFDPHALLSLKNRYWCSKCDSYDYPNPSYTTSWADYGPMLEWTMEQEWWPRLVIEKMRGSVYKVIKKLDDEPWLNYYVPQQYLNPLRGSTAIAEFLKERCKYGERKEEK